jgi:hypothetical protein
MHVVDLRHPRPGLGGARGVRQSALHELRRLQAQVQRRRLRGALRRQTAQVHAQEVNVTYTN